MTIADIEAAMTLDDAGQLASNVAVFIGLERARRELRLSHADFDRLVAGDSQPLLVDPTLTPRVLAWAMTHSDELLRDDRGAVPPFDHLKDFWVNFYEGPRQSHPVTRHILGAPTRLLDFDINFPFGVPACALTPHSGYIRFFSERDFDLITYKTVRDRPWNPHPFPHWGFAPEVWAQLERKDFDKQVIATLDPTHAREVGLVNSFGVPSLSPEEWQADVEKSKTILKAGQVLIVSVMGSPEDAADQDELAEQFATGAGMAVAAGADIVEVNLSCPNTGGKDIICKSADTSEKVVSAVSKKLAETRTPLFIKISYMEPVQVSALVRQCGKYVQGIVAINTVSVPVIRHDGAPFFAGAARTRAGLSGSPIRSLGLETVRQLADLREQMFDPSAWIIVGVGGVSNADHYLQYRDLGADAVQSCSGAWLNPNLALDIKEDVIKRTTGKSAVREGDPVELIEPTGPDIQAIQEVFTPDGDAAHLAYLLGASGETMKEWLGGVRRSLGVDRARLAETARLARFVQDHLDPKEIERYVISPIPALANKTLTQVVSEGDAREAYDVLATAFNW